MPCRAEEQNAQSRRIVLHEEIHSLNQGLRQKLFILTGSVLACDTPLAGLHRAGESPHMFQGG